ncbi:MAG: hypothetical protein CMH83_23145 [Nocardioides sp.]|nr:hypothetical protein [Nocardioides sp.]
MAATQDRYVGREEYAASQVATAYLALVLAPYVVGADTRTYPVPDTPQRPVAVPKESRTVVTP